LARFFRGRKLVIASHNRGKVCEIGELLQPYKIDVIAAASLGLTEPVENGHSFAENARIKALASSIASGLPAIADDSGLVVHLLGGEPGIYSARWAGPDKNFHHAMAEVERRLRQAGSDDRGAHFTSALCLAWPDGHTEVFVGRIDGRLVWPPRGKNGFGYDPMFVADGYELTFGEMDPSEKHAISHRAEAFRKLVNVCFER
jgi:XTP/dITP diphosphohydrolase